MKKNKAKELSMEERIVIASILPPKASLEDLIVIRDLRNKIGLTQEDIMLYEIKTADNGDVTWNIKGGQTQFPYIFTNLESELIRKVVKKLSDEGVELPMCLLRVYELLEK